MDIIGSTPLSGRRLLMFQGNILPQSSECNSKLSKSMQQPRNGGSTVLQNFSKFLLDYMM
jgi:hypothetical protein